MGKLKLREGGGLSVLSPQAPRAVHVAVLGCIYKLWYSWFEDFFVMLLQG